MRRALDRIGADVTAGEVDALVKRMDVDDDGKVSYPEFVRWFNTAQDNAALMGQHDATAVAQIVTAGTSGRPYASGFFYDWATGAPVAEMEEVPLAPKGSVGEWLEKTASPQERRNFFELMNLLTVFERRLGIQQSRPNAAAGGRAGGLGGRGRDINIQLGSKLSIDLVFRMAE